MGSGHILVYAFDVLMEIYEECGYTRRDAVSEIVQNNLYGIDIDKRCSQLAYFSVMMKARSYDRRFFTRHIQPHTYYPKNDEELTAYGSLFTVTNLEEKPQEPTELTFFNENWEDTLKNWNCRLLLSQKYAVVCTNPPYLNKYNSDLKKFVTDHYKAYSGDLFSVFMFRNFGFCKEGGYSAFMTPFVWMFIKTYENLRRFIIENKKITTLVQMEYSAFEEATVPICSFVLKNGKGEEPALCFRLSDFRGGMEVQKVKVLEAIADPNCGYFYEAQQDNFAKIPGSPVAYWISQRFVNAFLTGNFGSMYECYVGMRTGDNAKFLRFWHEVDSSNVAFSNATIESSYSFKWIPYLKGGDFRRWYNNYDYVVNWLNNGEEIKENTRKVYPQLGDNLGWKITNEQQYFRGGITFNAISSSSTGFKLFYPGAIFSNASHAIMSDNTDSLYYALAFLNTKVVEEALALISPTINYTPSDIKKLPFLPCSDDLVTRASKLAHENVDISKADWDAFETSWDFKKHPLV